MKRLSAAVALCLALSAAGLLVYGLGHRQEGDRAAASSASVVPAARKPGDAGAEPRATVVSSRDEHGRLVITSRESQGAADAMRYIYKWRDDGGVIVISSYPPDTKVGYEVFGFAAGISAKVAATDGARADTASAGPAGPDFASNVLRVYTPEGLRELIRYSRSIGEKVEIRDKELDDLIELL